MQFDLQRKMKAYHIGHTDKQVEVLLTIETVDGLTETSAFQSTPSYLQSPFYISAPINCGKIINITDVTETKAFQYAFVTLNGKEFKVNVGQFFLAEKDGLVCFMHKIAALEDTKPHAFFTGVRYTHYRNGLLKEKQYCVSGKITHAYCYRDDLFNSLHQSYICNRNHGKPEQVFLFNEQEIPVGQKLLTSTGKVFSEQSYP
jgi:hypothetical protein